MEDSLGGLTWRTHMEDSLGELTWRTDLEDSLGAVLASIESLLLFTQVLSALVCLLLAFARVFK